LLYVIQFNFTLSKCLCASEYVHICNTYSRF